MKGPDLWAEGVGRRPTWLEGFFDLVFAVAVTQLSARLGRDPSPLGAAEMVFLFLSVWWAWVGTTVWFDRFDAGQRWLRLVVGAQLLFVAVLAVHVGDALEGGSRVYALGYVGIRLILVGLYAYTSRAQEQSEAARQLARHYWIGFLTAALIWLLSAFVPPPWRFAMWAVAMVIDYGTPISARYVIQHVRLDRAHLPERFGLFTLIVLGESIAAAAAGLAGRQWDFASALAGAFGIAAAMGIWWSYFDNLDDAPLHLPLVAGQVWFYAHLPLLMAMTTMADGVRLLVTSGGAVAPVPDRLLAGLGALATVACLLLIRLTTVLTSPRNRPHLARVLPGAALGAITAALAATGAWPAPVTVGLVALGCALPTLAEGISVRRSGWFAGSGRSLR